MYMTIEGLPGTGVDEDESAAVAVEQWRWGMYDGSEELAGSTAEWYALTIVRELDPASRSIEQLYLNRTGCPNLNLYEYTGAGTSKVKATVLALKQVNIVYYTTVSLPHQEPLEIVGLRFTEASVRYPVRKRDGAM